MPAMALSLRRFLFPLACLAMGLSLAAMSLYAHAQLLPKALQASEPAEPDPAAWEPPAITAMPADWWSEFDVADEDEQNRRINAFLASLEDRIDGLGPADHDRASAALDNLANLVRLLKVTRAGEASAPFPPVPTQDAYSLREMLGLRAQSRNIERELSSVRVDIEQADRQLDFLQSRRDELLRAYQSQPVESPAKVLIGIDRITMRVEFELVTARQANLEAREKALEQRDQLVSEQLDFARAHLEVGDVTAEEIQQHLDESTEAVAEADRQVTALQSQLLDVLSADNINRSLEQLRRQQITRAAAASELARLEAALARSEANWYGLRTDSLDGDLDLRGAAADARALSERILPQLDVWSENSRNTLVSPPTDDSANAAANQDIARTVARETLDLVEEIRSRNDDLLLVQGILTRDVLAGQSGLRKAWSRLKFTIGSAWDHVIAAADYHLFDIGDTPVTPGGILKMLFIIALAWLISWVARYLIAHAAAAGEQFSASPVAYTLGRILHYVIMTVGLFAAFASIGFDFTSFALIAGALSVGIGFGLQAVVNNFVSGLILLLEGSLRVGDYIELDGGQAGSSGLAGVVKEINTRATVVNTNDSVDVVVPNSELVTTKLTNWTLRESIARMRIPFGVAYGSDKEQVKEIAMAAAEDVEFVLTNMPGRRPQLRLFNFGDSALEFQMLLWVSRAGVRRPHRIRCEFLWALETRLREAGIEIPFPQRDLHVRSDFRQPPGPVAAASFQPLEPDDDVGGEPA
ncbi:mechanosensitive ion channel domain-containing protein [Marinihelvus fidelis]|nr:mechanosensitive ion channel domain-containing protein [Marinihelvus fidelis]